MAGEAHIVRRKKRIQKIGDLEKGDRNGKKRVHLVWRNEDLLKVQGGKPPNSPCLGS